MTGALADRSATGGRLRGAPGGVAGWAVLLSILVIWAVPAVVLATGVHAILPLAAALLGYGVLALQTGRVREAVVAAVPVLATVNATVPLRRGPSRTVDLQVVVGDAAVLAAAVLVSLALLRGRRRSEASGERPQQSPGGSIRPPADPLHPPGDEERGALGRTLALLGVPGLLLAAFAGWALLAAPFALHDPVTAAVFGVLQLRYVAYFAVAAALVATGLASVRSLAVALVVAVLAHTGLAVAQLANGGPLGLAHLGETVDESHLSIGLLGFETVRGRYLGALVGNNAAYATVALPAAAVLAWIADRTRGWRRWLAAAGIGLLGAFCVPLSQYDSATVAFATVLAGSLALATLPAWPGRVRLAVERDRALALGAALTVAAVGVAAVFAAGPVAVFDALPVVGSKNLATRLADYANAVGVALERPLFGVGGGNVEPVGTDLGFTADVAIHSVPFSYLAETGFPGAALWTAAVVATAVAAVRLAWARGGRDVVAYLCVGAVGFLLVAMIDQIWDNHTSLGTFWLFGGAIVGAYRREVDWPGR